MIFANVDAAPCDNDARQRIECVEPGSIDHRMLLTLPIEPSWDDVQDELSAWALDRDALEYEGIDPPTCKTLIWAYHSAEQFRLGGIAPPKYVYPTANGGITFEFADGDLVRILTFLRDCRREIAELRGGKVLNYKILD